MPGGCCGDLAVTRWDPLPVPPNATLAPGDCRGKLTILESAGLRDGRVYWLCRCACGNLTVAREEKLVIGRIVSCGCWRADADVRRTARQQVAPERRKAIAINGGTALALRRKVQALREKPGGEVSAILLEQAAKRKRH